MRCKVSYVEFLVMIGAPAAARPASVGDQGRRAASAVRTAQMITRQPVGQLTRESVRKQRGHSLAAAQPHQYSLAVG